MAPELKIGLTVTGTNLDFSAINAAASVMASAMWRQGDSIGLSKLSRKQDGWYYELPVRTGYHIGERVTELSRLLSSRTDELCRLCKERGYEIEVTCVATVSDENPSVLLSAESIEWMYQLRASFDLDLL